MLFNELNSSADNDVTCQKESFTGSRTRQRVCRSNSANQADAKAARSFLNSLLISSGRGAGAGGPQVNAAIGTGEAQSAAVMGRETAKAALEDEMERLLGENRELYRAVVAYVDRRDEYNRERGSTNVRTGQERDVSIEWRRPRYRARSAPPLPRPTTGSSTRSRASLAESLSQSARQPREPSPLRYGSGTRVGRISCSNSARRGSVATIRM